MTDLGLWDAHACVALFSAPSLDVLSRHREAGCRTVGVNAGFDGMRPEATREVLARLAGELERSETLDLVGTVPSRSSPDLGVYFDIEGATVLEGDVGKLDELVAHGLRSLIPVYNRANQAGGGCHDDNDTGLTRFGRELIRRQNELGVIVDASHCSVSTSVEMCQVSELPVIFSHSNCKALVDHPRNVTDDQLRAAAATDGVVGICGASSFAGSDDLVPAICAHILHALSVVGPRHVGIGLDYVYDPGEIARLVAATPGLFPSENGYEEVKFGPPEMWPVLRRELAALGLDEDVIDAIGWKNFARVATRTFAATSA